MQLTRTRLAAYSAPALPIAALATPLSIYAPPFFAADMGLGLAAVGGIFMAARFWDLITDPLMGVISDKLPSRWGRRRHWLVLSVPMLVIPVILVMFPNYVTGSSVSESYLMGSLFLLYIGYTMLTISHMAWGAELTDHYHGRSSIQGWREFAHLSSMVLVLTIPAALELSGHALSSALKMNAMGAYVLILLPVAVLIAVTCVGERPATPGRKIGLQASVRILLKNPYILRILLADLLINTPSSIRASMYIFYVTAIIGMPEWAAVIMLSYFAAGPIAVPLWLWLAKRFSKHKACAAGVFLHAALTASYLLPGKGDALLFAGIFFLSGIVYAGVPFLIRSMVADVVDYDRLHTGQDRTALYYATVTTTQKVGGALGIGLGYPLLAFVGFNVAGENDAVALDGLRYIFAFLPAVTELLVVYLLYTFPLDEEKVAEVQAKLASHERRTN